MGPLVLLDSSLECQYLDLTSPLSLLWVGVIVSIQSVFKRRLISCICLLAEISFLLFSLGWRVLEKRRLLSVETHCVEHVRPCTTMCGSYLATESSCDTSCCAGSRNNSGITIKECAGHSKLKSQSANISWGMRFEECRPRLWTVVESKWDYVYSTAKV